MQEDRRDIEMIATSMPMFFLTYNSAEVIGMNEENQVYWVDSE